MKNSNAFHALEIQLSELSPIDKENFLRQAKQQQQQLEAMKPLAVINTPFDWLTSLPGFSAMPRQRPRRLAKVTFPHRLDRDEAMGICYAHFDELLREYDLSNPPRTPFIVTTAAPGSGKTFFLDEVGATRPVDVDKFCKSKWAPAFKSAVTISISFNGCSGVNKTDRNDRALCARMLYSYFQSILPDTMGFESFFELFTKADMARASPRKCIEFIVSHFVSAPAAASAADQVVASSDSETCTVPSPSSSGPVLVLLMVDELAKSKCEMEILSAVRNILDDSPSLAGSRKCLVLPLFTSLHETMLVEQLAGLQRVIMKVPLRVALKSAPAAMKELLQVPRELQPLIDVLCNDVGYHGRMLEAIAKLLHPTTDLRREVNDFIDEPFRMLHVIQDALFEHTCSAEFFRDLTKDADVLLDTVCRVLLGRRALRTSIVLPGQQRGVGDIDAGRQWPTSQWTHDYLLSQGLFIADAGTSTGIITPVMSPLQLVKWASTMLSGAEKDLSPQMILFLQAIKRAFSAPSVHNQAAFQEFHHDIEFIRRFALRQLGVRELTPMEYFKPDDDSDYLYREVLPKNPAACLQTKMDLGAESKLSRAKVKFSDMSKAIATRFQSGSKIELAAADQELFDIRIIQPTMNGKRMLCIFEQHEKSDDHNQNDDRVQKWMQKVQSLGTLQDAVFVYVTARDLKNKDVTQPANVILLDQENLARFYGPTVMGAHVMTTTLARAEEASRRGDALRAAAVDAVESK